MIKKYIHNKFAGLFTILVYFFVLIMLVVSCEKRSDREQRFLFNGVDLNGWIGDTTIWKVEDQQIIGSTMEKMIDRAIWLTTDKQYDNFEISMWVKLIGDTNKNSGIYYRGEWQDEVVVGYEFDIGGWGAEDGGPDQNWWGELHDAYRREDLWIGPGREVIDNTYKEGEWNFIKIRVEGNHIQHWLNGRKMVDWYEQDTKIQSSGFIAFQLHDESQCKVYYKDIKLILLR